MSTLITKMSSLKAGSADNEKIVNLLLKYVENVQKKSGTLRDEDSLDSQKYQTIRDRIQQLLENLIRQMELIISLSKAQEDVDLLESVFSDNQMEFLKIISHEITEGNSLEEYEKDILEFLNEIFSSKEIRVRLDILKIKRTPDEDQIMDAFMDLKKVIDWRMKVTADKDLEKEKILHKLYKENLKMEEKINDVRDKSEKNQQKYDRQIAEKMAIIDSHRSKIDEMKKSNRQLLTSEISQSEKNMTRIFEVNADAQETLEEDVKIAQKRCEQLLQDNLIKEKSLREQKTTAQLTLKSWLNRYDTDIGDRTRRLDELNAIYKKEQTHLNKLRRKFEVQEKEYLRLMAQKETEEKQIQEEKLLFFIMNRAATIIQRAWRTVLAKRKLKKGKKKGKKKK